MEGLDPGFVGELVALRAAAPVPPGLHRVASELTSTYLALLFPQHARVARSVESDLVAFRDLLVSGLSGAHEEHLRTVVSSVLSELPRLRVALLEDAAALADGDPAASGVDEVVLAYPGFYAVAIHRLSHLLHRGGAHLFARLLSELSHGRTGVDLHPGATIGRAFSVDHGTGVVVGETAVIGDRVRLYQGVTIGAVRVAKRYTGARRHPTVEDDVVVYANATILGGSTVVGRGSVIGGNVWLTHSVPPGSLVSASCEVSARPVTGEG